MVHGIQSRKQQRRKKNKKNLWLTLKIQSIFITFLYFRKSTLETSSSWSVTAHLFLENSFEHFPFLCQKWEYFGGCRFLFSFFKIWLHALRKWQYMRPQKGEGERNWDDFIEDWVWSFFDSPKTVTAFSLLLGTRWTTWYKDRRIWSVILFHQELTPAWKYQRLFFLQFPPAVEAFSCVLGSEDLLTILQANNLNFCLCTSIQIRRNGGEKFISFSASHLVTAVLRQQEAITQISLHTN